MNFIRKILYPFSFIYGMVTTVRNWLYDAGIKKSTKFKIPTIIVGNLSVGGTGKTPQIELLVRLLKDRYKVAVLSRGYKRKSTGFLLASPEVSVEELGDEPFQFYTKFSTILVAVDARRVHGIQQLLALETPPEIVLLDDAYQHRKVQGGCVILLTPYDDLYVNDSMLPTGNLRESSRGAKRAQVIIVTKCPFNLSLEAQADIRNQLKPTLSQNVFFSAIVYEEQLLGAQEVYVSDLVNYKVVLVTGIANPNPLLDFFKTRNISLTHLNYPDHHHFTPSDVSVIQNALSAQKSKKKIVITTEKDYVRLKNKVPNLSYISIKIKILNHQGDFNQIITDYVEQSRGNR
ncbi:MAG: tetraacyldisaccharide 4'-kinase [Flavobacteriaceae bacterium]|nr:tetraacyldisaccharide 4'-kinase [Flavobacteriaceae bacterium]